MPIPISPLCTCGILVIVEPAMMLLIQLAYVQQLGQVGFKLLRR